MIAGTWPDYSETPGNLPQCGSDGEFRTVADIGDEMLAIQLYVTTAYDDWQVWGFEAGNEPNIEWYRYVNDPTSPSTDQFAAWQDMDGYFSSIYEYVTRNVAERYPNLFMRVLTPPMAQGAYAETRSMQTCSLYTLQGTGASGYEAMSVFSGVAPAVEPVNDGYSWHNYYSQGKEAYTDCPNGQHVSRVFPWYMWYYLSNNVRPGVITEADLASPSMGYGNPITDKDADPAATFNSLNTFVAQESLAPSIAIWLLNDNITQNPGTHSEHRWHQAYDSDYTPTYFRNWFWQWWNYSQ
jgi:hypothetical protein